MRKIGLLTFVFLFCAWQGFCADPFALNLLSQSMFTSDFGDSVVESFEDVDPVTNIGPTAGTGPVIGHPEINAFKNTVVKEATGRAFIDAINSTGGRALHDPGLLHFLKQYVYLDAGGYDEDGNWHDNIQGSLPFDYDPGNRPHNKKYFLCIRPGWQYIPPFSLDPNAKSCNEETDFCNCPPCEEERQDTGDEDGDGDTTEMIPMKHHQPTNNVYKDLGNYIYTLVVPGPGIGRNGSGIAFEMNFADRTPPRIIGCVGDEFPELGLVEPAKTGDWYAVQGLKIKDNISSHVGTCLVLGKIDGYPTTTSWMTSSEWVKEEPFRVVESDTDAQYVIMPNICHGVMLYSIFTWDKNGLLNPGEPRIVEDKPEICYGLSDPPVTDLGKVPDTAEGWPLTLAMSSGDLLSVNPDDINPDDHRGKGFLNIVDNDLPNIAIKFESVKDGSCVFFPPVVAPGDLPILNSSKYKETLGLDDANAADYENFIGDLTKTVFSSDLASETASLYFKVLEILPSPVMQAGEHSMLDRIKGPTSEDDFDLIRRSFRLEDYQESDTDVNGVPIVGDEETFGKRNGVGGEVIGVLTTPLQEDVEYIVSVWVDDNVKWATKDEFGAVLTNIISIPTGVTEGSIKIEIPNQLPRVSRDVPLDPKSSVSPPFKVVFREPTLAPSSSSVSYYHDKKFPFIEVEAKDFSGLVRKIKLFVSVSNENPDIRIIERQHRPAN